MNDAEIDAMCKEIDDLDNQITMLMGERARDAETTRVALETIERIADERDAARAALLRVEQFLEEASGMLVQVCASNRGGDDRQSHNLAAALLEKAETLRCEIVEAIK